MNPLVNGKVYLKATTIADSYYGTAARNMNVPTKSELHKQLASLDGGVVSFFCRTNFGAAAGQAQLTEVVNGVHLRHKKTSTNGTTAIELTILQPKQPSLQSFFQKASLLARPHKLLSYMVVGKKLSPPLGDGRVVLEAIVSKVEQVATPKRGREAADAEWEHEDAEDEDGRVAADAEDEYAEDPDPHRGQGATENDANARPTSRPRMRKAIRQMKAATRSAKAATLEVEATMMRLNAVIPKIIKALDAIKRVLST